ncbi:hypothetical protein C496_16587 [Natronorubrum tibetense GA33]|uniref:Uncharacterized protein n=1 Tax=Natronorubrum tibetense GA33 TaxID=1114856 RepID=L9VPS0_9EURY|nr:hypothetical protein C496_16587 [Natronorubrum tibetense GA33]
MLVGDCWPLLFDPVIQHLTDVFRERNESLSRLTALQWCPSLWAMDYFECLVRRIVVGTIQGVDCTNPQHCMPH